MFSSKIVQNNLKDRSFYQDYLNSITKNLNKNAQQIQFKASDTIEFSIISHLDSLLAADIELFFEKIEFIEKRFKNSNFEIVLAIDGPQRTLPDSLSNFINKKKAYLNIFFTYINGISYFIAGGLRSHGKYLINSDYLNKLGNNFINDGRQYITFINYVDPDPLPSYEPSIFYKIGAITFDAFHSVFKNVHSLNMASSYEVLQICKGLQIQVQVIDVESDFTHDIKEIYLRKFAIAYVHLLYQSKIYVLK